MSNLRILVFAAHFAPHVGGVERFTRELWGRVARRGHAVSVVTSDTGGAPACERVDDLDVTRVPALKIVEGRLPLTLPSPLLWRTLRDHRRARPDVIVTNTRFFTTSVVGMMAARRWRVPTLHIDHGSQHIPVGAGAANAVAHAFDHSVGGWVLRRATRCVGVSRAVADFLAHLGRRDAGVLYNGVDAGAFGGDRAAARARLGLPPHRPVLAYVGRLIEDKGITVLLDAFDRLGAAGAQLIVAGDGPMMPAIRQRVAGRSDVTLSGFLQPAAVRDVLTACDVFVHPSAYPEGLPTAILEAGAAGAAVVATPMGGTAEVITSPLEGVLVPPRDPAALSEALRGLLADAPRRAAVGEALRRRVAEVFDWERLADEAEGHVRSLAANGAVATRRL